MAPTPAFNFRDRISYFRSLVPFTSGNVGQAPSGNNGRWRKVWNVSHLFLLKNVFEIMVLTWNFVSYNRSEYDNANTIYSEVISPPTSGHQTNDKQSKHSLEKCPSETMYSSSVELKTFSGTSVD